MNNWFTYYVGYLTIYLVFWNNHMDKSPRLWGIEWQEWANKLLQRHYGPGEYQKIPDQVQGDAGIEGFSLSGDAYQIYGPQNEVSSDEEYNKYRRKISQDIKKFINNKEILLNLLGRVKIRKWILLVPSFRDKRIVEYAAKQTEQVISRQLPYVDKDFRVCIEDENAFQVEKTELLSKLRSSIVIDSGIDQSQVDSWINADNKISLLNNLDSKAVKIVPPERIIDFKYEIISAYLKGQNIYLDLRSYPETYQKLKCIKSQKESLLTINSIRSQSDDIYFNTCITDLESTISKELPQLNVLTTEAVAFEAVADWILRCPLNFK